MRRQAVSNTLSVLAVAALVSVFIAVQSSTILGGEPEKPKGGQIEGTLVERGTSKPLEGLKVDVCRTSSKPNGRVQISCKDNIPSSISDSQGRFHFKDLRPGDYVLMTGSSLLRTIEGKRIEFNIGEDGTTINLGRIEATRK